MDIRCGNGIDVHRLVSGRKLILCGVEIPYEFGLEGHSDADVALHALSDALLGALALGDIGIHFPDTDPQWKGADSGKLLQHILALPEFAGWQISNVDLTIVAQRPKLLPHVPQMRENIAQALGIDPGQVSIKGKTEEGLGFTGSGEGMAVHAVCLIEKD